jgi:hypothetical protein
MPDGTIALAVNRDELLAGRRIAVLATDDPDGSTYLTAMAVGPE